MYWYYKYPLIVILVVLGIGIVYTVWRSLPEDVAEIVTEKMSEPFDSAQSSAADADDDEHERQRTGGRTDAAPAGASRWTGPGRSADEAPLPVGSSLSEEVKRLLTTGENQFAANNYLAARQLALKALGDPGVVRFDRAWYAAADLIDRVNRIFMNSQTANPERRAYTVQPGDNLSSIAVRLNTTVGAIQRASDLDPTNPIIYPGNVLYRLEADWRIHVDKSEFVLLLDNGDELYRLYRVGIGKHNKTPVGTFVISNKVVHPAWTPPGKNYPYGDPENPLGTHWLGLDPVGDTDPSLRGYGIHGTWEPETIGTDASRGCIRMLNEDVKELFDFVPQPHRGYSVPVTIED